MITVLFGGRGEGGGGGIELGLASFKGDGDEKVVYLLELGFFHFGRVWDGIEEGSFGMWCLEWELMVG